jgi:hypothetical protein
MSQLQEAGPRQKDCRTKKVVCKSWNKTTKVCTWEKKTGGKCKFNHEESVSAVEAVEEDPQESSSEIAWMFHAPVLSRKRACKNIIQHQVYKTLTTPSKERACNKWVIDGAATLNLWHQEEQTYND